MSCLEDEVENIPLWKCSNSGYCSNWKSKGPCSLLFCPYRLFKYMPQSLTLLVVVVTVTIKTNVHLVGKGGLKRHLPSRHLKRKFIKTTKPKTTELYCSIAHSTHNAFLTEKKKISSQQRGAGLWPGFSSCGFICTGRQSLCQRSCGWLYLHWSSVQCSRSRTVDQASVLWGLSP